MGAEIESSSAADGGGGGGGREMAARRARMAGLAAEREQVRFGRAVPHPPTRPGRPAATPPGARGCVLGHVCYPLRATMGGACVLGYAGAQSFGVPELTLGTWTWFDVLTQTWYLI